MDKYYEALWARQYLKKIIELATTDAERKQASAELESAERRIAIWERHSAAHPTDSGKRLEDRPQVTAAMSFDENKVWMTEAAATVKEINHKDPQLPFKLRNKPTQLPTAQAQIKKGKQGKPRAPSIPRVYERPGAGTVTTKTYRDLVIAYWTKERARQAEQKAAIRKLKRS